MLDISAEAMKKVERIVNRLGDRIKRPRTVVCDARHLKYPDASFDIATLISMIEHPPQNGVSEVMAEVGRVLKAGGIAYLDFPYGQRFSVNRLGTRQPWKEEHGLDLIERRYDLASIAARLAEPSGLEVVQQGYALGGWLNRLTAFFNACGTRSGKLVYLWAWLYMPLAYAAARFDDANAGNAEFAFLVLRKPNQDRGR